MKLEVSKLALPQLDALKGDLMSVLTSPDRRRALLAGMAAALALGFWYFGLAQPTAARVAAFKSRHETAQRELRKVWSASGVAEAKTRVTALEARVRAALGRMSQDVQLVQILKQLSADAVRYQITVDTVDVKAVEGGATPQASPPKPREGSSAGSEPEAKTKPLEIRVEKVELTLFSSYGAAARFLDGLKTLPAFLVIDALKVERDASTLPNLKVLLTLKLHSIKKLPEELTKT